MASFRVLKAPVDDIAFSPVVFENSESGLRMAGTVFVPRAMKRGEKRPAILVQGPMGATKEQCQSLYAQWLAAKGGYVTMVYDYTYLGASEGLPRGYENPQTKASDIRAALSALSVRPEVDSSTLYAVGICGSGVYLPIAVSEGLPVNAFASVNPFTVIDTIPYDAMQVARDKEVWESGGAPVRIPDLIEPGSEGAEYYRDAMRGAVPNRVTFISWSQACWAECHPLEIACKIATPALFVLGEKAFTRPGAEEMFARLRTKEKHLVIISGARHFDMYDGEDYAMPAIDAILDFFQDRV